MGHDPSQMIVHTSVSCTTADVPDTFPMAKRIDEAKCGDYRTKSLIIDIYDRMQDAITTGRPCEILLSHAC